MDEPKETLSDRNRLNECQSMIRERRTHLEKCTKLNYKATKYASELRLFASVDYYLQGNDWSASVKMDTKFDKLQQSNEVLYECELQKRVPS